MNRQDFEAWVERSAKKYESEQLLEFEEWELINSKIDFKAGADAAFNLLSKEISEKDKELVERDNKIGHMGQEIIELRQFKAYHSQFPSQGLKWVKASERLPDSDKVFPIKIDGETIRLGNFFEKEEFIWLNVQHFQGDYRVSPLHFEGIEWLDESAPSQGLPFIKASERLPEKGKYKCGMVNGKPAIVKNENLIEGFLSVSTGRDFHIERIENVEWLDESAPSQGLREAWTDFDMAGFAGYYAGRVISKPGITYAEALNEYKERKIATEALKK